MSGGWGQIQSQNQRVSKAWVDWGLTGMDLDPGPPATDKGYIWGNRRLGGVKTGVFASKICVLVLTMSSFGMSLE